MIVLGDFLSRVGMKKYRLWRTYIIFLSEYHDINKMVGFKCVWPWTKLLAEYIKCKKNARNSIIFEIRKPSPILVTTESCSISNTVNAYFEIIKGEPALSRLYAFYDKYWKYTLFYLKILTKNEMQITFHKCN